MWTLGSDLNGVQVFGKKKTLQDYWQDVTERVNKGNDETSLFLNCLPFNLYIFFTRAAKLPSFPSSPGGGRAQRADADPAGCRRPGVPRNQMQVLFPAPGNTCFTGPWNLRGKLGFYARKADMEQIGELRVPSERPGVQQHTHKQK